MIIMLRNYSCCLYINLIDLTNSALLFAINIALPITNISAPAFTTFCILLELIPPSTSIFIFSCLKDFTSSADKTAASLSYLSLYFSEGGVSVHSDSANKFIDDRQKGAAKGIATLDENVKIPVAQIPDEIARMENVNTAIQSAIGNALGGSY